MESMHCRLGLACMQPESVHKYNSFVAYSCILHVSDKITEGCNVMNCMKYMQYASCDFEYAACYIQYVACGIQYAACGIQYAACGILV